MAQSESSLPAKSIEEWTTTDLIIFFFCREYLKPIAKNDIASLIAEREYDGRAIASARSAGQLAKMIGVSDKRVSGQLSNDIAKLKQSTKSESEKLSTLENPRSAMAQSKPSLPDKPIKEWASSDVIQFVKSRDYLKPSVMAKIVEEIDDMDFDGIILADAKSAKRLGRMLNVSDAQISEQLFNDIAKIKQSAISDLAKVLAKSFLGEISLLEETFMLTVYQGRKKIKIKVSSSFLVSKVTKMIAEESGISTEDISMMFAGRFMDADKTLADCGVTSEFDLIHLAVRTRGGGVH